MPTKMPATRKSPAKTQQSAKPTRFQLTCHQFAKGDFLSGHHSIGFWVSPGLGLTEPLEDAGCAHAAAYAHGYHAVARPTAVHLLEKSRG